MKVIEPIHARFSLHPEGKVEYLQKSLQFIHKRLLLSHPQCYQECNGARGRPFGWTYYLHQQLLQLALEGLLKTNLQVTVRRVIDLQIWVSSQSSSLGIRLMSPFCDVFIEFPCPFARLIVVKNSSSFNDMPHSPKEFD